MSQQRDDLLDTLFIELFQTERSAIAHPAREAVRYGDAPPGVALRAISEHATAEMPELERLAALDEHRIARLGVAIGEMFSLVRQLFADRVISMEKSYRFTLIGLHHGIDLVTLIRELAAASSKSEIVAFCTRWLATRRELVVAANQQLAWLARHPDVAASTPTTAKGALASS